MPLRGGSGALVRRRIAQQLITEVPRSDVDETGVGVVGWLERLQARRSALVLVPDRPSGVKIALRWGLSPEKFRIEGEFQGESWMGARPETPWYKRV
jgi:hypothetical protein